MSESLRDRQKQLARVVILQAAADEIAEKGLEALALQAVADRAGVSKRTLYNYFDSREALLRGIGEWSDQLTLEMVGFLVPTSLEMLPGMVGPLWRTWKAQGTIYEAVLHIQRGSSDPAASLGRRTRRVALSRAVTEVRPDLSQQQCDELAAMLHVLISAPVFRRLTVEDGLDLEAAASLVAWAVTMLRDSITTGNDPFPKEELV